MSGMFVSISLSINYSSDGYYDAYYSRFLRVWEVILSRIKNLFPIALFLVISACSNTEEEASKALRELSNQFEVTSLWNFGTPRPGLMDEIEVDLALNAVIEITSKPRHHRGEVS